MRLPVSLSFGGSAYPTKRSVGSFSWRERLCVWDVPVGCLAWRTLWSEYGGPAWSGIGNVVVCSKECAASLLPRRSGPEAEKIRAISRREDTQGGIFGIEVDRGFDEERCTWFDFE